MTGSSSASIRSWTFSKAASAGICAPSLALSPSAGAAHDVDEKSDCQGSPAQRPKHHVDDWNRLVPVRAVRLQEVRIYFKDMQVMPLLTNMPLSRTNGQKHTSPPTVRGAHLEGRTSVIFNVNSWMSIARPTISAIHKNSSTPCTQSLEEDFQNVLEDQSK